MQFCSLRCHNFHHCANRKCPALVLTKQIAAVVTSLQQENYKAYSSENLKCELWPYFDIIYLQNCQPWLDFERLGKSDKSGIMS